MVAETIEGDREMPNKGVVGLTLVLALLIVAPSGAQAAGIPRGDYVCSSSFGYAGTLNIKSDSKYSVNDGKKGKYAFSRKHKTIAFKTGDYRSFFGGYIKKSKAVDVYEKKSGDYLWSCYR